MDLKSKRKVKEFQEEEMPSLKDSIDDAAGFEVDLDIQWESLIDERVNEELWFEGWTKVYFLPTISAFEAICSDKLGREALEAELESVVFKNVAGMTGEINYSDGVLTVDKEPCTNMDKVDKRTESIVSLLEGSL
ncbi:hypothetical protein HISP_01735 [Haloarcula hispanica N601]|uniref:Uncharacterized protein n=3 Tax=Haloarcula hispanica TaxID=51589 RepID=V5TII0_HALHI|nr:MULTISPECIES: hypothetical protein [Haloarcula]AHB64777.1 hypothetical protein HISP_01735 [Haloarcula hispanica N601]AJF25948.1 hypothetical protein SG26_09550 [Haloarcula sp. CBA1115]KAA9405413.1 hypothetical protein Har1131_00735 [Haloarcula sp. CBA1131]KAA9408707.1 hypothetical protein EGO51_02555 [Haloarcula hispanica]KZX49814.1 hypothetical protein AV929_15010 [Haloarcula sp. K1]